MNESDRRNIERKIVDLLYYIWSIRSLLWPYVIKVIVIIARNKDAIVKHQERSYLLTSTMNWETEFKNVHLCVQQVSDIDRSITFCCYKVKTYVSKMSTAQSLNKPACFPLDSREFLASSSWLGKSFISTNVMGFCHPIKVLVIFQLKKINKTGVAQFLPTVRIPFEGCSR